MDDQKSALECSLFLLAEIFKKHCEGGESLQKCQFKQLVMEQMPHIYLELESRGIFDDVFRGVDLNKNDKICFPEFVMMIGGLACACHEKFINPSLS